VKLALDENLPRSLAHAVDALLAPFGESDWRLVGKLRGGPVTAAQSEKHIDNPNHSVMQRRFPPATFLIPVGKTRTMGLPAKAHEYCPSIDLSGGMY
jgi:hypothetical protein